MTKTCIVSIVDDDASVREAIEDLVSSLGMVACTFESAEDFLNSRSVDETTCLITDEQMPGMKGHELQRHLRAQGHGMPIIFITAFPEKCGYDRNEQSGMIALLEKHGVKKFDPAGEKFDPNVHQAMYEVPDPSVPSGTVVQVVQAGYMIGERILRPALVGVSKGGAKAAAASSSEQN